MTTLLMSAQSPKPTLRERVEYIDQFLDRKLSYDQLVAIGTYDYVLTAPTVTTLGQKAKIEFTDNVTHVAAHYLKHDGTAGRFFASVAGGSSSSFNKLYNDVKEIASKVVFIAGISNESDDTFTKTNMYFIIIGKPSINDGITKREAP